MNLQSRKQIFPVPYWSKVGRLAELKEAQEQFKVWISNSSPTSKEPKSWKQIRLAYVAAIHSKSEEKNLDYSCAPTLDDG